MRSLITIFFIGAFFMATAFGGQVDVLVHPDRVTTIEEHNPASLKLPANSLPVPAKPASKKNPANVHTGIHFSALHTVTSNQEMMIPLRPLLQVTSAAVLPAPVLCHSGHLAGIWQPPRI